MEERHVAVEAKASGTGLNEALLRRAYNQLHGYVNAEHGTIPPYLMVVDVPHELIIWDGWTGRFGGFARGERIRLEQLPDKPELVALLQDIFTNPAARDPRGIALRVTKDIAGNLAQLAAAFEDRGHPPEQVARFRVICVGAEYTPREYIERLVEPTVIEPIRERWTAVQARVTQLEEDENNSAAGTRGEECCPSHRGNPTAGGPWGRCFPRIAEMGVAVGASHLVAEVV